MFLDKLNKIIIVTGHYGTGKTNLAVNLALDAKRSGREVLLVDLDIVNPYFRSADFMDMMSREGINVTAPAFANTNLDLPSLSSEIYAAFEPGDRTVIVDVGGDDAGAFALGRYAAMLTKQDYSMLYVVNRYRFLTQRPEQAVAILKEIETASRFTADYIVNNSHLAKLTTMEDIKATFEYTRQVSLLTNLPLLCHTVPRCIYQPLNEEPLYPIDIYVNFI